MGDAYNEGRDTNTKTSEVVGHIVGVGGAGECDSVLRRRDSDRGWYVVCEAAVFVEVDDEENVVPVLGLADGVVEVLDHHLTGS